MEGSILPRKIRFDPEDLLPISSLPDRANSEYKFQPFKKLDPEKWVKTPEFVPQTAQIPENIDSPAYSRQNAEFSRFLHDLNSTTITCLPQSQLSSNSYDFQHLKDQFRVVCNNLPMPGNFVLANSQQLNNSFVSACFSVPSLAPHGYSANFATINDDSGLSIATIVLKKKRKRRHRRPGSQHCISLKVQADRQQSSSTQSNVSAVGSLLIQSKFRNSDILKSQALRPSSRLLSVSSEPELCGTTMDQSADVCLANNKSELNGNIVSGSCPDLSDEQLKLWDEILFKAVQNEREALDHKTEFLTKNCRRRTTNSDTSQSMSTSMSSFKRAWSNTLAMQTSIYELCAPVEMEQNEEEGCCDFNGNLSNSNIVCQESSLSTQLKEAELPKPEDKTDSKDSRKLSQKSRSELEDLQFRSTYEWQQSDGQVVTINTNPLFDAVAIYPQRQEEFLPTHMCNYDPKTKTFASTSLSVQEKKLPEDNLLEADFFENMNIRVNPFEDNGDIVLNEVLCPPSRFQQLQWAIRRQKEHYNEQLQAPQRVCCSIM